MRILVVTNMYPGRNKNNAMQGIFVREQLEAIERVSGYEIEVFVIEGFRGKLAYLKSAFSVVWKAWRGKHDVVHYHFGLSAFSAPLVRLLTSATVVITLHGSDVMGGKTMKWFSQFFLNFSDGCIAVSEEIKSKINGGNKYFLVIPCAVNEVFFEKTKNIAEKRRGEKTLVFPSSPTRREKDYGLFKKTIQILMDKYNLKINEKRIDGLDREEVRDLLGSADCLILTSQREGSPQVVKEAMAMNLPVVTVDVGDVRRLLADCEGNSVVDSRDPEALANEVAKLLSRDTPSRGRDRLDALGYFSGDVAGKVIEVYRKSLR